MAPTGAIFKETNNEVTNKTMSQIHLFTDKDEQRVRHESTDVFNISIESESWGLCWYLIYHLLLSNQTRGPSLKTLKQIGAPPVNTEISFFAYPKMGTVRVESI